MMKKVFLLISILLLNHNLFATTFADTADSLADLAQNLQAYKEELVSSQSEAKEKMAQFEKEAKIVKDKILDLGSSDPNFNQLANYFSIIIAEASHLRSRFRSNSPIDASYRPISPSKAQNFMIHKSQQSLTEKEISLLATELAILNDKITRKSNLSFCVNKQMDDNCELNGSISYSFSPQEGALAKFRYKMNPINKAISALCTEGNKLKYRSNRLYRLMVGKSEELIRKLESLEYLYDGWGVNVSLSYEELFPGRLKQFQSKCYL